MDESFQKENDTIQDIQGKMVQYFLGRRGKLAQDGISGRVSLLSKGDEEKQIPVAGQPICSAVHHVYWM